MPSSSSSEEDLTKFKEAADSTLYNDSLFKVKPVLREAKLIADVPPSLRSVEEEDESFRKELRVTPEFQTHVAKHLTKLLDSQLDINDSGKDAGAAFKATRDSLDKSRQILKPKRKKNETATDTENIGGVRLLGASAVFLSNMNLMPIPHSRRKRGRNVVNFSSGSESSSEESENEDVQKLSAAAVSSEWVLSGAATKGWTSKGGKVERCIKNKSGVLVPLKDDISRGYESLGEISCSNNNSKEQVVRCKDDMALSTKSHRKKATQLDNELAASFSSVVSIGSDSQGDASSISKKKKLKKKKKKRRKELHSEDATTETTEVEEVEVRRKKKEKKKKSKRLRIEEKKAEETAMLKDCVPGLIEEDDSSEKWKRREKSLRKKKSRKERMYLNLGLKGQVVKGGVSKKKINKKVLRLSEDLAKLMMTPNDPPEDVSL